MHVISIEGRKNNPSEIGRNDPVNILSFIDPIEGITCENYWSAETYHNL